MVHVGRKQVRGRGLVFSHQIFGKRSFSPEEFTKLHLSNGRAVMAKVTRRDDENTLAFRVLYMPDET